MQTRVPCILQNTSAVYEGILIGYLNVSYLQVITTLMSGFLGSFDFTAMHVVHGFQGSLFLLVYLLTMMFLVLNLFISLINEYIAMVKKDKNAVPKDHEVVTHLMETLRSLFGGGKKKETKKPNISAKGVYG